MQGELAMNMRRKKDFNSDESDVSDLNIPDSEYNSGKILTRPRSKICIFPKTPRHKIQLAATFGGRGGGIPQRSRLTILGQSGRKLPELISGRKGSISLCAPS